MSDAIWHLFLGYSAGVVSTILGIGIYLSSQETK